MIKAAIAEDMHRIRRALVALTDLPGVDGLTAAGRLPERLPECRVPVLTGHGKPGTLLRARDAGWL